MARTNPRKRKSKGLGDTVEKVTKATGIKAAVKWLAGEDCGCDERKEALNKLWPYQRKTKCLEEDEYNWLTDNLPNMRFKVDYHQQKEIVKIYNRVFNTARKLTNCGPCVGQMIEDLKSIHKLYGGA